MRIVVFPGHQTLRSTGCKPEGLPKQEKLNNQMFFTQKGGEEKRILEHVFVGFRRPRINEDIFCIVTHGVYAKGCGFLFRFLFQVSFVSLVLFFGRIVEFILMRNKMVFPLGEIAFELCTENGADVYSRRVDVWGESMEGCGYFERRRHVYALTPVVCCCRDFIQACYRDGV